MSSLLKQDTFYSEFGDSGLLYTYPTSVGITLGDSPRIVIYSKILTDEVEPLVQSNSKLEVTGIQELASEATILKGGVFNVVVVPRISSMFVGDSAMVAKDPSSSFIFADSAYLDPGKVHDLDNHSFVLSGD